MVTQTGMDLGGETDMDLGGETGMGVLAKVRQTGVVLGLRQAWVWGGEAVVGLEVRQI